MAVYAISGLCAALGGMILTARVGSAEPIAGAGFELNAIAAVVIGGTSLFGGVGSVWGTMAGVFIITILSNILNLTGVPSNFQFLLKGGLLVLAVMVYRKRTR